MKQSGATNKRLITVVGVAAFAVLAVAAYRFFSNRPGEAAITLIPDDASVVVTLDTNPSEQQVLAFKKINDALKDNGLAEKIDKAIGDMTNKSPIAKNLRPYLSHSFAYAGWYANNTLKSNAVFLAVQDRGKVSEILKKDAHYDAATDSYTMEDPKPKFAMVEDYLIIAEDDVLIGRIRAVKDGKAKSVASSPEYMSARSALPKDANLMVFVGQDVMKGAMKSASANSKMLSGTSWMAAGLTVRNGGLALDYRCPMPLSQSASLTSLKSSAEVSPETLRKLPAGAYGVVSYSEVGKWAALSRDSAKDMGGAEAEKQIGKIEEDTGLSLDKDVFPSLNGDVALAVYPGPSGKPEDLDGILYLGNSRGSNPMAVVQKLIDYAKRKAAEAKKPIEVVTTTIGGATIYRLDPKSTVEFQEGMASGAKGSTNAFLKSKQPIIIAKDGAVVLVSSEAMSSKAIDSLNGSGRSLADDPAFATMQTEAIQGSQGNMMISINRVLQALRPSMEESMAKSPVKAEDLILMFGGDGNGIVGSGKYDGNTMYGSFFMPLDYTKAVSNVSASIGDSGKSSSGIAVQ